MKTKTILIVAGIGALILYFINKNKNKQSDETSETKAPIKKNVPDLKTALKNIKRSSLRPANLRSGATEKISR